MNISRPLMWLGNPRRSGVGGQSGCGLGHLEWVTDNGSQENPVDSAIAGTIHPNSSLTCGASSGWFAAAHGAWEAGCRD
jgi:hypothetical protein